jgi:hypothetical protein
MSAFRKIDDVGNWENFICQLIKNDTVSHHQMCVKRSDHEVQLMIINGTFASVSISVSQSFNVEAMHYNTHVPIRDLLGFAANLTSWSQLEAIIYRALSYPLSTKAESNAVVTHLEITETLKDSTIQQNLNRSTFLYDQLRLHSIPAESRRYLPTTILQSIRLYLTGSASYAEMRKILCLPHPNILFKNIGSVQTVGGKRDCETIVGGYFSILTQAQRQNCILIFDEIYIKPSLRFRGGHLLGQAEDDQHRCARTILAIMVKPMLGATPFIARLIPIYSLRAQYLKDQLESVSSIIENAGGKVIGCICDNHFVNRQLYQSIATEESFLGKMSLHSDHIVLLYDSVHILKNIRNNWITESSQEIQFQDPTDPSHHPKIAKWADILHLQRKEENNTVRVTQLTRQSCFPTPIERQKVSLVVNVFNDKTVAELQRNGFHDTATFVSLVLKIWKILNAKNIMQHNELNDPDRRAFYSTDDSRIMFLENMLTMFHSMKCKRGPSRNRSLTTDTQAALVQTLKGFLHLINTLLGTSDWKYILLGQFQSDDLEGEFGVFRQMSGGCYYISVEQVLCSARLRRMKLLTYANCLDVVPHDLSDCCTTNVSEEEWTLLDDCVEMIDSISEEELCSLYYISGYISYKENILCDQDEQYSPISSEFTTLLSRGELSHPPQWLFSFSQAAYCLYENFNHRCLRRFLGILNTLFISHFNDFDQNPKPICRRLANCFFKGEVRKMADLSSGQPLQQERNLRKLNSS